MNEDLNGENMLSMALPINILIDLFANPEKVREQGTMKLHEKQVLEIAARASESAKRMDEQSMKAAKNLMEKDEEHARLIHEKLMKGTTYNAENLRKALILYMYGEIGQHIARLKQLPEEIRTIASLVSLTLDHGNFTGMLSDELRDKMLQTGERLAGVMQENAEDIKRVMENSEEATHEERAAIVRKIEEALINPSSDEEKMKELINKARATAQKD